MFVLELSSLLRWVASAHPGPSGATPVDTARGAAEVGRSFTEPAVVCHARGVKRDAGPRSRALWLVAMAALGCAAPTRVVVEVGPAVALAVASGGFGDATPEFRHGRRRGVRVGPVRPGSLASELQLREGDLITAFDGTACDDLMACRAGVEALERALLTGQASTLSVERDGRRLALDVRWGEPAPLPSPAP